MSGEAPNNISDSAPISASISWFAGAARRLSAATRAAGLIVPAFRCPPRIPGVPRSIKRFPGGAVISVVLTDRSPEVVAADLVEGILAVNNLEGEVALRFRTALLEAAGGAPLAHSADLPSGVARVAERQTQAA